MVEVGGYQCWLPPTRLQGTMKQKTTGLIFRAIKTSDLIGSRFIMIPIVSSFKEEYFITLNITVLIIENYIIRSREEADVRTKLQRGPFEFSSHGLCQNLIFRHLTVSGCERDNQTQLRSLKCFFFKYKYTPTHSSGDSYLTRSPHVTVQFI